MPSFASIRSRKGKLHSITRLNSYAKRVKLMKDIKLAIEMMEQHSFRRPSPQIAQETGETDTQISEPIVQTPSPDGLVIESNDHSMNDSSSKSNDAVDDDPTLADDEDFIDPLELTDANLVDSVERESPTTSGIDSIELEEGQKSLVILTAGSDPFILKEACIHLTLLWGNLIVDGYRMQIGEKIDIITASPFFFTLLEQETVDSSEFVRKNDPFTEISEQVKKYDTIRELIENLKKTDDLNKTVLLLEKHASTTPASRVFHTLRSCKSAYLSNVRFFEISIKPSDHKFDYQQIKAWDGALEDQLKISACTVAMILGPNNSGKSTVLKRLINKLKSRKETSDHSDAAISHVVYVDLDPGQTEFSPPGVLTVTKIPVNSGQPLFPVSFANALNLKPELAVSVAAVSPQADPDAYARAILSIAKLLKANFHQKQPIFVNTMGWISGLGRNLLVDAIKSINPSDVIELVDSNRLKLSGDRSNAPDSSRPCNLFSFASVTTPGLGWTAESQMPNICSFLTPYNYIQLNFCRAVQKVGLVGQWNRTAQVISNLLSGSDTFHFQGLTYSHKHPLDLRKIFVYSTYSRQRLPVNVLSQVLHLAWVQLAIGEVNQALVYNLGKNVFLRSVSTLANNRVIGYGITLVETERDEQMQCATEGDSGADKSANASKKLTIVTHLNEQDLARVNLIILTQGVGVPSYILNQMSH